MLLVWKPVEFYGPVTYIVQCSLEGRAALCPCLLGGLSPVGEGEETLGHSVPLGICGGKCLAPSAPLAPFGEILAPSSLLGSLLQGGVSPPPNSGVGRPGPTSHLLYVARRQLEHTGLGHLRLLLPGQQAFTGWCVHLPDSMCQQGGHGPLQQSLGTGPPGRAQPLG